MQSPSPYTTLWQTLRLLYKTILALAVGTLLVALGTTYFHFKTVQDGIQQVAQYIGQGRLAEANALAASLEPWARCFPGRYRACARLRVRSLVRSNQPDEALQVAEAIRAHAEAPIRRGTASELLNEPLLWLQKTSLFLAGDMLDATAPVEPLNEWAGYDMMIAELVAVRDEKTLNALADSLNTRFPQSSIAYSANSAKIELQPAEAGLSTNTVTPGSSPSENTPLPPADETASATSAVEALPAEPERPPPSWGIVTNAGAVALNPKTGQLIRPLKIGDVLAIEGTCTVQNVSALTGTLILENRNVPDLAFQGKNLEIRTGDISRVSSEKIALLSRLAEVQAEEALLQPKAAQELAGLSPEELAYRKAQSKMDAFQRDVNGLNTKLEKATGAERMKTLDQLRLMKYQEQALIRDLQACQETANLVGRKTGGRLTVEPQLTALRQEKKAILKRLAEHAP